MIVRLNRILLDLTRHVSTCYIGLRLLVNDDILFLWLCECAGLRSGI